MKVWTGHCMNPRSLRGTGWAADLNVGIEKMGLDVDAWAYQVTFLHSHLLRFGWVRCIPPTVRRGSSDTTTGILIERLSRADSKIMCRAVGPWTYKSSTKTGQSHSPTSPNPQYSHSKSPTQPAHHQTSSSMLSPPLSVSESRSITGDLKLTSTCFVSKSLSE